MPIEVFYMKSSLFLCLFCLILIMYSLFSIGTESTELMYYHVENIYEMGTAALANLVHPEVSNALETATAKSTTLVYPHTSGIYETGADGHRITLVNYNNTTNPTYAELLAFIKADKTDEEVYNFESCLCSDYAEIVHNNAEKAGYKCAWVGVDFAGGDEHALNAFNTTDKGMIFVDCTGADPYEPGNTDKVVSVQVGKPYAPVALFREGYTYDSMGTVKEIYTYW
jgi:hypothetical protein